MKKVIVNKEVLESLIELFTSYKLPNATILERMAEEKIIEEQLEIEPVK